MKTKILHLVRELGAEHQLESAFHCGFFVGCQEIGEKIEALPWQDQPADFSNSGVRPTKVPQQVTIAREHPEIARQRTLSPALAFIRESGGWLTAAQIKEGLGRKGIVVNDKSLTRALSEAVKRELLLRKGNSYSIVPLSENQ